MTLALYWPKLARRHIARVMQLRNRFCQWLSIGVEADALIDRAQIRQHRPALLQRR